MIESEMQAKDVVMVTTEVQAGKSMSLLSSQPPFQGKLRLAYDLWAGKLDDIVAETLLDSCEPRGHWVRRPLQSPFSPTRAGRSAYP